MARVRYDYRPDGDDAEATAAITLVTGGNFRLIGRLMTQIARVIDINHLDRVTPATPDTLTLLPTCVLCQCPAHTSPAHHLGGSIIKTQTF